MGQMADDFVHQAQYRLSVSCYLISRQICQMQKMLPYFDWPRQLHLLDQMHIIKGIGMHEMHTEMEEIFTTLQVSMYRFLEIPLMHALLPCKPELVVFFHQGISL
jgi:hypothetical protein